MELLPFQKEALSTIINRFNGRSLVALDMGLGKTPIAIAAMVHYFCSGKLMVVICPASLKLNWRNEIDAWAPGLKVRVIKKGSDEIEGDVVVMSYETAAKKALEIAMRRPGMVVLDEAHYIKNRNAIRTKQLIPVCRGAPRCLLLTGTPVLNRPAELYTQLCALNLNKGDFFSFARRYCNAHKGRFGWDFSGASNLEELNRVLLSSCMVRKRKSEVLKELPDKRRMKVAIDAPFKSIESENLLKLCRAALKSCLDDVPTALARLKKVAKNEVNSCLFKAYSELGEKKTEEAIKIVLNAAEQEPLVIFAHHQSVIHRVHDALMKAGIESAIIDGATSVENRQKAVEEFQAGKLKVVVCSITAASTGLTLTAASTMILVELVWSPGVAIQAEDRIHRIGQKEAVVIQYLVAAGTLDEAMWKSLNKKASIAHVVLDGAKESEFEEVSHHAVGNYWDVVEEILITLKQENVCRKEVVQYI